jgi:hypothetical protein
VKNGPELIWQREASLDVAYDDHGVDETFAPPELIRIDQVTIGLDGAAVHIGQVVIQHADGCTITPGEARKLAEALVELADWAEGLR